MDIILDLPNGEKLVLTDTMTREWLKKMFDEDTRKAARIAELEADANRLDFMDLLLRRTQFQTSSRPSEKVGSDIHMGGGSCSIYIRDLFGNAVISRQAKNTRELLDAAISASKEKEA